MPTPTELREASRQARLAAAKEPDPHLKRRLANHAFALAQLAEKMEREAAARGPLASQKQCPVSDTADVDQCDLTTLVVDIASLS